jgi:hypothetical protein
MIIIQPTYQVLFFGPEPQNPVAPISTSVTPSKGFRGQQISVVVTGNFFVLSSTTFSFGAGITVSSLVINNQTTATMLLTIDPAAVLGFHDLTTTGTPGSTVLSNAFQVLSMASGMTYPPRVDELWSPAVRKWMKDSRKHGVAINIPGRKRDK